MVDKDSSTKQKEDKVTLCCCKSRTTEQEQVGEFNIKGMQKHLFEIHYETHSKRKITIIYFFFPFSIFSLPVSLSLDHRSVRLISFWYMTVTGKEILNTLGIEMSSSIK
ncbi:hypothetical protein AAZX31_19G240100 [Glycine max]